MEVYMGAVQQNERAANAQTTLTKAVVRATGFLGLSQSVLADVLGVSGATVSRLMSGAYSLQPTRKREWEFALLFVRLFRSLNAIVGNDRDAQTWLRDSNTALGGKPHELIKTAEGLIRVVHYLDASRGRI
jgi:transcriptional regulator with XRE-family HTH domain